MLNLIKLSWWKYNEIKKLQCCRMCFLHGALPGSRHFFPSNSMVSQQILLRLIASFSCTLQPLLRAWILQGGSHCSPCTVHSPSKFPHSCSVYREQCWLCFQHLNSAVKLLLKSVPYLAQKHFELGLGRICKGDWTQSWYFLKFKAAVASRFYITNTSCLSQGHL